ncbi:hypothetical protein niasHT_013582 [Heterodera trifolii]|uniref:Uncharacterized protein n=1 Tax=Heterodera trifolii TaxID=157864 RepID=A0ABD2LF18_9BILA
MAKGQRMPLVLRFSLLNVFPVNVRPFLLISHFLLFLKCSVIADLPLELDPFLERLFETVECEAFLADASFLAVSTRDCPPSTCDFPRQLCMRPAASYKDESANQCRAIPEECLIAANGGVSPPSPGLSSAPPAPPPPPSPSPPPPTPPQLRPDAVMPILPSSSQPSPTSPKASNFISERRIPIYSELRPVLVSRVQNGADQRQFVRFAVRMRGGVSALRQQSQSFRGDFCASFGALSVRRFSQFDSLPKPTATSATTTSRKQRRTFGLTDGPMAKQPSGKFYSDDNEHNSRSTRERERRGNIAARDDGERRRRGHSVGRKSIGRTDPITRKTKMKRERGKAAQVEAAGKERRTKERKTFAISQIDVPNK